MRTHTLTCLLLLGASVAVAEDKPAAPADPAAAEKAWLAFSTPGEEHKQLARLVGSWTTATKMFNAGKTSESKGKAEFKSILGGRFVQQSFEGEMEGVKFTGVGLTGYDNAKKKFIGSWMDTMSTGIIRFEGTYDEKTNTLTEMGTASSAFGEMKMKMTSHYKSADEFFFTMYMVQGDNEVKMMEITYTRKK